MSKVIHEISNTKKDIKLNAAKIRTACSTLMTTEMQEILQGLGKLSNQVKETTKSDHQTNSKQQIKRNAETGTQTEPWHETNQFLLETLDKGDTYNSWKQEHGKDWKEDLFKNIDLKVGNSFETEEQMVKVVLVEPNDPETNRSFQRTFRDKYPDLTQTYEPFEVLEQTTRLRTKAENKQNYLNSNWRPRGRIVAHIKITKKRS
ncbi:unnamed protein product [Psylliodes chrysocephalus]|uniref:Uncharacterized protein n=1 Tax=Psylliodes chrysocephalus TaxID=3402493 RepID=A0A9P0CHD5_9CUCU|nr:unnamed protein product [Psylliodes chrysocephala]